MKDEGRRTGMKLFSSFAFALCFLVMGCFGCGGDEEQKQQQVTTTIQRQRIVIGRIPSGNVIDIAEKMDPLKQLLEQKLDVEVAVRFTTDYKEFTGKMERQEYDMAFCAPFQYIAAHEKAGYEAVLRPIRHGADTYVGLLITAKSEITSIEQLRGKRIAFVDQGSSSGYLFPLGLLAANGISLTDIQPFFLKGHDNVVLNVLSRSYDAGACYEGAEKTYGKARAGEIKIIAETDPIYNEPIAISPKFRKDNPELAEKIVRVMTELHQTPEGAAAIAKYGEGVSRFVAATDADYNSVRLYREKLPDEVIASSGL
ncbi:MAG: phosphate/phosphite/phosphonate ABC transporter substrate-binding protein [Candidatus Hydrogenedentota bacterium]